MPFSLRAGAGAIILAAVASPLPAIAADARHPLDPAAASPRLELPHSFEVHVPLLDRDAPRPSFVNGPTAEPAAAAESPAATPMPMDHAEHGGHRRIDPAHAVLALTAAGARQAVEDANPDQVAHRFGEDRQRARRRDRGQPGPAGGQSEAGQH